jgi:hypothetical protein
MKTNTTLHASESNAQTASVSKGSLWAGRIMSALAALFLLMDAVMKLVKPAPVVEGTVQLGFPESVIFGLGIVLLVCVILYVIPHTSILGAILLTGYLGGAGLTGAGRPSALLPHALSGLRRRAGVGWAFSARIPVACTCSSTSLVRSPDAVPPTRLP